MKRISLIRTSSDRKSEPSRRDERCARVGITGASVRYEARLFEVIEGTDHHVDAEIALLRNLPDADVVIVGAGLSGIGAAVHLHRHAEVGQLHAARRVQKHVGAL